jgi:hypothetical protein
VPTSIVLLQRLGAIALIAVAVTGCGEVAGSVSTATSPDYKSIRERGEMCERLAPHTEVAQARCESELEGAEGYAEEHFGR